jgi:hypothetical protein
MTLNAVAVALLLKLEPRSKQEVGSRGTTQEVDIRVGDQEVGWLLAFDQEVAINPGGRLRGPVLSTQTGYPVHLGTTR